MPIILVGDGDLQAGALGIIRRHGGVLLVLIHLGWASDLYATCRRYYCTVKRYGYWLDGNGWVGRAEGNRFAKGKRK